MRVLVTNSQKPQTYEIMRCLRPHAERIISVKEEGWSSFADRSRHVDERYTVSRPVIPESSADDESNQKGYLKEILDICQKENIDTIFPSRESDLYVLAQNRKIFDDENIILVAPEFETLKRVLDKSETIQIAQNCNFPVPKTLFSPSEADLDAFSNDVPAPWVIKPRTSSGSAGMAIVRDKEKLVSTYSHVSEHYPAPIIQELIPGRERQNFYILADGQSNIHHMLCPKIVRYSKRLYRNSTASCISASDHPFRKKVSDLVKNLKWTGEMTLQTKIDVRDGEPKLLEVNAGARTSLWYKTGLGINDPLNSVFIAQGKMPQGFEKFKDGVLLLDPVEDIANFVPEFADLLTFAFRTNILRRTPTDPKNVPPSIGQFFGSYITDYFGPQRKVFSPSVRFLLDDPKPNIRCFWQQLPHSFWRMRYAGQ